MAGFRLFHVMPKLGAGVVVVWRSRLQGLGDPDVDPVVEVAIFRYDEVYRRA